MGLNPLNFIGKTTPYDNSGLENLPMKLLQAYQMPMKMEREQQEFDTANALKKAQANYYNKHADYYEKGGPNTGSGALGGIGKDVRDLRDIKDKHGEDSPEYKQALALFDAKTNNKFSPTALAKANKERNEVIEGYRPGTNQREKLTPEEQDELLGQYDLDIQKKGSDSGTRRQALAAVNVLKAFDQTNIDDLVRYSGPAGQAKLLKDKALDLAGSPPPEYVAHMRAVSQAELEAKELRQMLGDSIKENVAKKIEAMMNPSTAFKSPKIAKEQILSLRKTLRSQAENIAASLKSTKPYHLPKGSEASQSQALQTANPDYLESLSPAQIDEMLSKYTPEQIEEAKRKMGL